MLPVHCECQLRYQVMLRSKTLINGTILVPLVLVCSGGNTVSQVSPILYIEKKKAHITLDI